jgi:hypothetical protein
MEEEYNLEQRRNAAEKIFADLMTRSGELEKKLQEISGYFNATKKADKAHIEEYKNLKRIFDSATTSINKFRSDKQNIGKLLKELQNFYDKKYLPLKEFVLDPNLGMAGTLKFTKAQKKEVEKISTFCNNQYKKITENVKVHEGTLKTLIDLEKGVNRIFSEITIRGDKTKAVEKEISLVKRLADSLKTSVEKNSKRSQELKNEIEELRLSAETTFNTINEFRNKSETAYKGILDIYEIAADTGRSGEFDRRRKALTYELIKWEKLLQYVTLFLLLFVVAMFCTQLWLFNWDIKQAGNDINFYLRFLLASPVIFYISFCSIQYSKVRKLIDQYTFKTTLAVSIKSHLELLRNDEKFVETRHIDDILKFTIEALQNIYKEPYNDDKMRIHLKMKEIELKLGRENMVTSKIDSMEQKLNEVLSKVS